MTMSNNMSLNNNGNVNDFRAAGAADGMNQGMFNNTGGGMMMNSMMMTNQQQQHHNQMMMMNRMANNNNNGVQQSIDGGSNHSTGSSHDAQRLMNLSMGASMGGMGGMGGMDHSADNMVFGKDTTKFNNMMMMNSMAGRRSGSGAGGDSAAGMSVQDKMLAFSREQFAKGQGLPMSMMGGGQAGAGAGAASMGMMDPMTASMQSGGMGGMGMGMGHMGMGGMGMGMGHMGMGMGMGFDGGFPNMNMPSYFDGSTSAAAARFMNLKRNAMEMEKSTANTAGGKSKKEPAEDDNESSTQSKGGTKKRKKGTKAKDMPRRALSAYNIFFSEQRELILRDIDRNAKEEAAEKDGRKRAETEDDDDKEDDTSPTEQKTSAEKYGNDEEKDTKKHDDNEEKDDDDDDADNKTHANDDITSVPNVMNRTFFPTRSKRAHRKVHGKIGLVDLAREVSKRWKELDPVKRKHYQDLAEEDRKKHKQIMAEYQERKAAENMVSLGGTDEDGNDVDRPSSMSGMPMGGADIIAGQGGVGPGLPAMSSVGGMNMPMSEQDMRENMAHQYQQRILAEMMAERRSAQQRMNMMSPGIGVNMSMNNMMSNMNGPMNESSRNSGGVAGNSNINIDGGPSSNQEMMTMLEYQRMMRMRMMSGMGMGGGMMGGMGSGMGGMGQ